MNRRTLALIALSTLLLAPTLNAYGQDESATRTRVFVSSPAQTTMVELFTSEGCSSCPPAEKWLSRYTDDEQLWRSVVPLAFHVDYWDDLGWVDPYASAENSNRQRNYKREGHVSGVYTPGIVVNGAEYRDFFNPVTRGRKPAPAQTEPGILVLTCERNRVTLEFKGDPERKLNANLAWVGNGIIQQVRRGENAGRRLVHDFVVLEHKTQRGHGKWVFESEMPEGASAVVGWVSRVDDQAPVQAVGGEL
ncbi:MAG: DUF1223 domain-containing protein [Pseudomonadales bacterium]|nr:DUF1223 domain-containing protein [Pseudomonadales bacterium]